MKKLFIYGVTASGLIFTACQSDDIPNKGEELSTDIERTLYVNLSLHSDAIGNETRAASDDGTPENGVDFAGGESEIKTAYFVFYDKDGNQVGGEPVGIDLSKETWEQVTSGEANTIEKFYQSTVGVTISNGQQNPTQVICYLNPQAPGDLDEAPLTGNGGIQTQTRPDLFSTSSDGTTKYFSMSNSVFYPTTESEAPQIAVQIAPKQLFNTEAAAKEALNDGTLTVNIYVERYAAKLEFQSVDPEDYVTATNPIDGSTGSNVILSFNAQTWMLNASCTDTYIVKSFREESQLSGDILADNYGYQELDDIINRTVNGTAGDWVWNSANYHRSYWGMSPAYFTSEYPEVSSDVKGITTLHQHYYSYNELINRIGGNEPVGYEVKTDGPDTHYVHETTVGSKALTSKNILAAFPSIILVGDYTIRIAGQTLTDTDFYTYLIDPSTNKPFVYFNAKEDSQVGESAIAGGESMLRGLIKAATNLYKKVDDNYENFDLTKEEELEKLVAVFEVAEPSVDVKGGLKTPERYRTLQLREGVTADQVSGIYVATADGYKTIIADKAIETPATGQLTFVETNQELMKVVGFCAKYNAGAAYFNIPVKHFGWYRSNNPNKNDTENMDWTKVRVGDFGIVRNHSYNVKVTEILGLGTGIGGKDNPIVPPAEENKYYLAYRVNILKWAVVPEQSVKL